MSTWNRRFGLALFVMGLMNANAWHMSATAATFQILPPLPGDFRSGAAAVSDDESTVVGFSYGMTEQAVRWTSAGVQLLGTLPGLPSSTALDVSSDGSIIVGYATSPQEVQGFFWSLPTGMMVLPAGPDGFDTFAARVSGDGSVIVGSRTFFGARGYEAVFWSPPSQLTHMGVLAAGFSDSQATAVSGNGEVIVGSGIIGGTTGHSFLWTSETGVQIPQLPGSPSAISHDGQVVFGPGYRWTIGGGMDVIPATENGDDLELSVITAANSDGSLGVGYSGNSGIIWDTTHGLRFFNDVVTSDFGLGAPFAGWFDMSVTDVSADGTIFVGHGSDSTGKGRAWIIDLNAVPEPATWSLLAIGAALAVVGRRAKRARSCC